MRFPIDIAERRPRLHPSRAILCVDVNPLHARQVDDHPALAEGPTADVVAAAANGNQKVVLARKVHGIDHVGYARAASNDPRVLVYGGVPDPPSLVISRIARKDYFPSESRPKGLDTVIADDVPFGIDQFATRHLFLPFREMLSRADNHSRKALQTRRSSPAAAAPG